MSWLSRVTNVFRSSRVDDDLEEELRFHIDSRIEDLVAHGMSRDAARRAALRQFGNPLYLRETSRDVKGLPWLEAVLKDIRFGLRMLWKDRLVAGAAVASLALALGACAAAFSLIDALILRPLPVRAPHELVALTFPTYSPETPEGESFSYPLFVRLRDAAADRASLFSVSHALRRRVRFASGAGDEEQVLAQFLSGDAFTILGVRPAVGRVFVADDDRVPGAQAIVVLSYGFWIRRFGGDPAVVGRSLTIDQHGLRKQPFVVAGVAERGFTGLTPGHPVPDLWVPNMMYDPRAFSTREWNWLRVMGRLHPGDDAVHVAAALQTVFGQFRRDLRAPPTGAEARQRYDRFVNAPLHVRPAANGLSRLRRDFARPLWILSVVVGLVLLIAASNVTNLLLARAAAREREMSVRLSIGAGRGRLIQQALVESGLLAAVACGLSLIFAQLSAPLIVRMLAPASDPAYLELRTDWRLLAFVALTGGATALLFGITPAIRASRVDPAGVLARSNRQVTSRAPLLGVLVPLQVSFSLAILFLAGLLLLSFWRLVHVDLGFEKDRVLLFDLDTRGITDREQAKRAGLEFLERIRALPGVEAASISEWAIFSAGGWTASVRLAGREPDPLQAVHLAVSPGFFQTMRIRVIEGREFEPRDAEPVAPTAVIVNEAFVRRYLDGGRALGRSYTRLSEKGEILQEVVGVVGDAKYNDPRSAAPPTAYVPLRGLGTFQVRAAGADPLALTPVLRETMAAVHPALRAFEFGPQSTLVTNTMLRERLLALVSGFFGGVGLILAVVGLYGVLNYSVVRRTREIGIRLAIGAQPLSVIRLIVADVGRQVFAGVLAGLAIGLYLSRFAGALLFEIEPLTAVSLVLPTACILAAAAFAAVPPARRATRVDPVTVLRLE